MRKLGYNMKKSEPDKKEYIINTSKRGAITEIICPVINAYIYKKICERDFKDTLIKLAGKRSDYLSFRDRAMSRMGVDFAKSNIYTEYTNFYGFSREPQAISEFIVGKISKYELLYSISIAMGYIIRPYEEFKVIDSSKLYSIYNPSVEDLKRLINSINNSDVLKYNFGINSDSRKILVSSVYRSIYKR